VYVCIYALRPVLDFALHGLSLLDRFRGREACNWWPNCHAEITEKLPYNPFAVTPSRKLRESSSFTIQARSIVRAVSSFGIVGGGFLQFSFLRTVSPTYVSSLRFRAPLHIKLNC